MSRRRYLFWCVNEHIEFRVPELRSVAALFKIPLRWIEKPKEDPFLLLEFENEEDARKIVSRCMLIRAGYELWGEGSSRDELHSDIKRQQPSLINHHIAEDKSFRIRIESYNKTLKTSDKLKRIESFSYLPFEGSVDLMNPITKLVLLEYYGLQNNEVPEDPYRLFFGRCIGDGPRDIIAKYTLKKRSYIGSTSMDAQLSFIMTNMAGVYNNSLVLDPFVGTGSILVSAAHHGAYVLGSDIDFLTLHAKTKPTRYNQQERDPTESIRANLLQYGLENKYLDVAVVDISRNFWRQKPFLDAIICDPPYGIRESTSRVGKDGVDQQELLFPVRNSKTDHKVDKCSNKSHLNNGVKSETKSEGCDSTLKNTVHEVSESSKALENNETLANSCSLSSNSDIKRKDNTNEDGSQGPHYPSKTQYNLYNVFKDLLNFAAHSLVEGGRLVYWLPVMRDEYTPSMVPSHPCLCLAYNCEQVLNAHTSRRLLTLVKTREPESHEEAQVDTKDLTTEFREKFFIASQMTREERMARKCLYPRDKRGQGLGYRVEDVEKGYKNNAPDGTLYGYFENYGDLAEDNEPAQED